MTFENRTVFISGASRGIGKAIALKLAAEGANIIVAAKSVEENPRLGGTIFSAADEIRNAGGEALPVQCDVRFEEQIVAAVEKGIKEFGQIDCVVNNASAISLANTEKIESKALSLMYDINVKGTILVSKTCIPYLKQSQNGHILNLSPPLNMDLSWFSKHLAYTISKYSMTMIALGLSEELRSFNVAANTLWPKTTIATAAVRNLLGGEKLVNMSRTPQIVADAAAIILQRKSSDCTGNQFIDEDVLKSEGITDLSGYEVVPGSKLYPDLFI